MKLFMEFTKLTEKEAHSEDNNTESGVHLNPGDFAAWDCPMVVSGGSTGEPTVLAELLALYTNPEELDPSDGPDQIVFRNGAEYVLATITVE